MDVELDVKRILVDALQIQDRADRISPDTQLLGGIPEFDSMAVVTVLSAIEESFGIVIEDDDVSADDFETFGTLVSFVAVRI